jgi:hypothetical protein
MANFASFLTSADSPPSVVSTSYSGEETAFDTDYLNRICQEFMKAGSRGISLFYFSGDYGVGGTAKTTATMDSTRSSQHLAHGPLPLAVPNSTPTAEKRLPNLPPTNLPGVVSLTSSLFLHIRAPIRRGILTTASVITTRDFITPTVADIPTAPWCPSSAKLFSMVALSKSTAHLPPRYHLQHLSPSSTIIWSAMAVALLDLLTRFYTVMVGPLYGISPPVGTQAATMMDSTR